MERAIYSVVICRSSSIHIMHSWRSWKGWFCSGDCSGAVCTTKGRLHKIKDITDNSKNTLLETVTEKQNVFSQEVLYHHWNTDCNRKSFLQQQPAACTMTLWLCMDSLSYKSIYELNPIEFDVLIMEEASKVILHYFEIILGLQLWNWICHCS